MILDFYQNVLGQEGYTTEAAELFTEAVDKLPALNVVTPRLDEVKLYQPNSLIQNFRFIKIISNFHP